MVSVQSYRYVLVRENTVATYGGSVLLEGDVLGPHDRAIGVGPERGRHHLCEPSLLRLVLSRGTGVSVIVGQLLDHRDRETRLRETVQGVLDVLLRTASFGLYVTLRSPMALQPIIFKVDESYMGFAPAQATSMTASMP